jgi:hypothetical protein
MDVAIFLVDPSSEEESRDSNRFNHLIHLILKTEIKEINLVSRRSALAEAYYLDQIPEKIFEKKGLINKIRPEKIQKRHLQVDRFDLATLIDRLGRESKREVLIYFEDEWNDLAYDGSDLIRKLLKMASERMGSIVGMKKIPFSEISNSNLLRGILIAEGEYRIQSVFKAKSPLQSSSNLAMTRQFILKPLFFKLFAQKFALNRENAFIESLDLWARSEPVFGSLSFQSLKIK